MTETTTKIKEDILAKHRLMRVLPRTQFELREQEDNLAQLAIEKTTQNIFEDIDKLQVNAELKSKIQELKEKYGLGKIENSK